MSCELECISCTDYKCRCQDCACLIEKENDWFCDELQEYCKDVENCGEYD